MGSFDGNRGLYGSLPDGVAPVLNEIFTTLRSYLLDEMQLKQSRIVELMDERHPKHTARRTEKKGRLQHQSIEGSGFGVDSKELQNDGVRVAIDVLNSVLSAVRVTDETKKQKLLLGVFGQRDIRRQAGTKKERRPEITEWIIKNIKNRPRETREELWNRAPESIKDDIGRDRFLKRVSKQRKLLGK